MSSSQDPWKKLASSVRAQNLSSPEMSEPVPYGLSTRVLAAWRESRLPEVNWERFGWGALGSALAVAVFCVMLNYNNLRSLRSDDLELNVISGMESIL